MVRQGGRTSFRVSDELFRTSDLQSYANRAPSGAKVADVVCKGLEKVYCELRAELLMELAKRKPDLTDTTVRESLTDIKTVTDLIGGGKCAVECEDARTLLTL